MKPTLQLKLGQHLTMTPQLQQAIRLLQMPVLELNTQLQEALAENVMLEMEEPGDTGDAAPATDEPAVVEGEPLDGDQWGEPAGGSRSDSWADDGGQAELAGRSEETLREHLLWQIETEHFSPRQVIIGQAIVDAVNDDGYLIETLDTILNALPAEARFTMAEVEETLALVQTLDPIGVAARDLGDCIRLQLEQFDPAEPGRALALRIAAGYLEQVAEHDYSILRRTLGVTDEDLDTALALVRSCHPRPGATIAPSTAEYIVPDVYVRKRDGKWVVEVNRSIAPMLRVNQTYAEMLRGKGEHANLRTQLQEAKWLVRSLEIRHDTLTRVALCIINRQIDFLEQGEEAMKPMVLRDVAEAVDMHESTISRVTANKYMHTPRGVFEFRYFFSSRLAAEDGDGDGESSTATRARIRRLIGQEDPAKPLSDSKITTLLGAEGVKVARRTVAKYREAMNIPPSSERRQKPAR